MIYRLILAVSFALVLAGCESSEERAEAAFQRGVELVEAGDDARATVEFRNAVKFNENHLGARLELARLNLRADRLRPAFRNFLAVVEQDPDHIESLQSLSRIAFLLRDRETFKRFSEDAISKAPDTAESQVFRLANDYQEALLQESGAAIDHKAIIVRAEDLRKQVGEDQILQRILVDGYINDRRYRDALAQLDTIIADNPDNREFYETRIQLLIEIGDTEQLETALRDMVEVFPDDVDVKISLLRFLISQEKFEDAEEILRAQIATAPDDEAFSAAVLDLVRFLQQMYGIDRAVAEIDRQITDNPDKFSLLSLQSLYAFETGNREAAIAQMEGLLALEGEGAPSPEAREEFRIILARMLLATGNEVGAQRLVSETLESNPNNANALKMQARWLIDGDDTNGAITAVRTALAEDPRDVEALTIMAQAYQRAGDTDLMLNFLSLAVEASDNGPDEALLYAAALQAQENTDQAERTLIASLRVNPGNFDVLNALGGLYLIADDRPRLQQVISALQELDRDDARALAQTFNIELVAREAGRDEALSMLSELAEEQSENVQLQIRLIRAQLLSGNSEEALAYIDKLIEENPGQTTYEYFRAVALATMQRIDEATAAMREVVEKEPSFVQPWLQLANLQSANGSEEETLATLDEALSINPDAADLLWAKASILERQSRIDEALEIYQKLYYANTSSMPIANNYASMLVTYKQDTESLDRARVVARRLRDSSVPQFQDTYGWILYRSGDVEASLDYLEPAAEALSQDPIVQIHLGMAYASLGRQDDAQAQLDRAQAVAGPLRREVVNERLAALEAALLQPASETPATE